MIVHDHVLSKTKHPKTHSNLHIIDYLTKIKTKDKFLSKTKSWQLPKHRNRQIKHSKNPEIFYKRRNPQISKKSHKFKKSKSPIFVFHVQIFLKASAKGKIYSPNSRTTRTSSPPTAECKGHHLHYHYICP